MTEKACFISSTSEGGERRPCAESSYSASEFRRKYDLANRMMGRYWFADVDMWTHYKRLADKYWDLYCFFRDSVET